VRYTIAALYRFFPLADPAAFAAEMHTLFDATELRGTLLIANEGINGTLAGSAEIIERVLTALVEKAGLDRAEVKFSYADEPPFKRLKFKIKQEIIAFRRATVDPSRAGKYVEPEDWNALVAADDVLLLDTRNHYETDLGTFDGASLPAIDTFSDFVDYVREHLDANKHRKVAMFCTGGIRCEKASSFLLQEGFDEVYHLKGGILKYLEQVPEEASKWRGTCYVFDDRVAVGHKDYADEAAPE
jgi:UPF0176 protein